MLTTNWKVTQKMAVKGLLIDRMGKGTITCLSIAYFAALLVLIIGGAAAPDLLEVVAYPIEGAPCDNFETCSVEIPVLTITDTTPMNQMLLLTARMSRPYYVESELPVLLSNRVEFDLPYTMQLTHKNSGNGAITYLGNLSHVSHVVCGYDDEWCDLGIVAYLPAVTFDSISIATELRTPLRYFSRAVYPVAITPDVVMEITSTMIAEKFTYFEMGAFSHPSGYGEGYDTVNKPPVSNLIEYVLSLLTRLQAGATLA